jgi:hypothetical protein
MPATFQNVPLVSGNMAWLNQLLRDARTSVRRFGWFGDSRHTSPGGAGVPLYPHLARASYARYGVHPETRVAHFGFDDGSLMLLGNNVDGGGGAVPIAANTVPPGFYPYKVQPGFLGSATGFSFRNKWLNGQIKQSNLWNYPIAGLAGKSVRARMFGIAEPGTVEPTITFPQEPDFSYFAPAVLTVVSAIGLNAPLGEIKQQTFLPTFTGPDNYDVLSCWPTVAAGSANLLGVRWENPYEEYGLSFQPLSLGGYQTTFFVASHSQCGPILNAIGLHAGIIHFGANDYGNNVTAAAKRDNTIAMIRAVRATMGNLAFPFVLLSDVFSTSLSAPQVAEWAQDAGAMAEVAASEPYCVALNLQRATHQSGWNADNNAWALADGVHWTEAGAEAVASLSLNLMFGDLAGGTFTSADRDTLAFISTQAAKINALSTTEPDPDSFSQFNVPLVAETDVRFSQPLSMPGRDITGWASLTFTVKRLPDNDLDSDAILTVRVSNPAAPATDGILVHRGRPVDPADALRTAGTVVVGSVSPDTTVTPILTAVGMDVPPSPENEPYTYEINVWRAATGGDKEQIGKAEFSVTQSVRRSAGVP